MHGTNTMQMQAQAQNMMKHHTLSRTQTDTNTHSLTHTLTHTRTHARTHAHTQTHTGPKIQYKPSETASEHAITAASVQKLLQKSRRVSVHVKEVKTRVDKQNTRVRKVENSQAQLLTRSTFRVGLYQLRHT